MHGSVKANGTGAAQLTWQDFVILVHELDSLEDLVGVRHADVCSIVTIVMFSDCHRSQFNRGAGRQSNLFSLHDFFARCDLKSHGSPESQLGRAGCRQNTRVYIHTNLVTFLGSLA
jgi:hypothetical protein